MTSVLSLTVATSSVIRQLPSYKGGGAWPNRLTERLAVDPPGNSLRRSFHTEGKMFGLTFNENWHASRRDLGEISAHFSCCILSPQVHPGWA